MSRCKKVAETSGLEARWPIDGKQSGFYCAAVDFQHIVRLQIISFPHVLLAEASQQAKHLLKSINAKEVFSGHLIALPRRCFVMLRTYILYVHLDEFRGPAGLEGRMFEHILATTHVYIDWTDLI